MFLRLPVNTTYFLSSRFQASACTPAFSSALSVRNQDSYGATLLRHYYSGVSSLGVPCVPWHTQILADQLTLFQPGGTDYAHLITTGTPGFSDLPTALIEIVCTHRTKCLKFFHFKKPVTRSSFLSKSVVIFVLLY